MTLLVVVKAYPVLDQVSMSEAVCVAGVALEEPRRWVRLFPLDFRGLDMAVRFKKYQVIEVEAVRSPKDSRPESYAPVVDSVSLVGEPIGTDGGTWESRRAYIDPLMVESMCSLQAKQAGDGTSLGVFRPAEISSLSVERQDKGFADRQRAVLDQGKLFGADATTRSELEPLPVKAKFHYRCSDRACRGHSQSLIDWELGALYRNLARQGDDEATIHEKIRTRFLDKLCAPERDVRFIAGSMRRHPASFLVLGLVGSKVRAPKPAAAQQPDRLF